MKPSRTSTAEANYGSRISRNGINAVHILGFELISKVPATLHTPLMSGANAISGITIVGALIAAGDGKAIPLPLTWVQRR